MDIEGEIKFDLSETADTHKECNGLIFRGYSSTFYKDGHIGQKQGVRLLKRKSCPGCEKCGWLLDEISEEIACDAIIFPNIEHGKEYTIRVINISHDYETGHCDGYDLEIVKITEA